MRMSTKNCWALFVLLLACGVYGSDYDCDDDLSSTTCGDCIYWVADSGGKQIVVERSYFLCFVHVCFHENVGCVLLLVSYSQQHNLHAGTNGNDFCASHNHVCVDSWNDVSNNPSPCVTEDPGANHKQVVACLHFRISHEMFIFMLVDMDRQR